MQFLKIFLGDFLLFSICWEKLLLKKKQLCWINFLGPLVCISWFDKSDCHYHVIVALYGISWCLTFLYLYICKYFFFGYFVHHVPSIWFERNKHLKKKKGGVNCRFRNYYLKVRVDVILKETRSYSISSLPWNI